MNEQCQLANKHVYEVRHADDDRDFPLTIEQQVVVNFWGSLICNQPLLSEQKSLELSKDEQYVLIHLTFEKQFVQFLSTYDLEKMCSVIEDRHRDYHEWGAKFEGDSEEDIYEIGYGDTIAETVEFISELQKFKEALKDDGELM